MPGVFEYIRLILLLSIVFASYGIVSGQSQNNIIINQSGPATQQNMSASGEIFINGVSSKEDVGGVEVSVGKYKGQGYNNLYFKNYNNFPVSVSYLVYVYENGATVSKTGTIVLNAKESKYSRDSYYKPQDFRIIARKMTASTQMTSTDIPQDEDSANGSLEKYGGYFYVYPDLVSSLIKDINSFISNLNNKHAYGKSNWRRATPNEARLVYKDFDTTIFTPDGYRPKGSVYYGTSETYENYDNMDKVFNFIIVCE